MRLDENWTVEPDTRCWVLTYEKTGDINPKTGKPTITSNQSYHANLKQALLAYLDKYLEPSKDVQDVLNRIREAEARIEAMK